MPAEKDQGYPVEKSEDLSDNFYASLEPAPVNTDQPDSKSNNGTATQSNENDKWIAGVIRTDRDTRHYEKAFGAEVTKPKGMILDLGAGDSDFAQSVNSSEPDDALKVVRFDYSYKEDPPGYKSGAVVGLAQKLPFADETFEKVVDSFMMMHIKPSEVSVVISEMIRVTKPGGDIMLYPAQKFRLPKSLRGYDFINIDQVSKIDPRRKTLKIHKDPSITDEEWSQIAQQLASVTKLPKIFDLMQRISMKLHIKLNGSRRIHKRKF